MSLQAKGKKKKKNQRMRHGTGGRKIGTITDVEVIPQGWGSFIEGVIIPVKKHLL